MPLPTAKAIDIVAVVPAESIDPVRIGDSYLPGGRRPGLREAVRAAAPSPRAFGQGSTDGARITLTDEGDGRQLAAWP
jgi:hypothetical protein